MVEKISNRRIITTEDGRRYKKAGVGKRICGYLAGNTAGTAAMLTTMFIGQRPALAAFKTISNVGNLSKQVNDTLEFSGLSGKGIKIIDASIKNNKPIIDEIFYKELPSFTKKIFEKCPNIKKILGRRLAKNRDMLFEGMNALFATKSGNIIVNTEKLSISAFHEMGHALNATTKGLGKIMQKCRPLTIVSSATMLIGLLKRKKVKGEKPKNFIDKATTFVKDHCGAIAFAGFIPTVIEEGMASYKGYRLAQKVLDPSKLKSLAVFNGKAWLTYAAMAIGTGLAAHLGSKIKDAIAKPKEITSDAKA